MMAKTVVDVLIDKLDEEIVFKTEAMMNGVADSEYRELVGTIRGLGIGKAHAKDLLRQYIESEDNDS